MAANTISIPAASALLVRDSVAQDLEVLIVRRSSGSREFGGMWAFPGGKIDAADVERARLLGHGTSAAFAPALPRELLAHAIAGWREVLEETAADPALEHAESLLRSSLSRAIHWSHWHAPRGAHAPFDTHFFLIDAAELPHDPRPDGHEISDLRWVTPRQAVSEILGARLPVAPPTAINLMELELAARTAPTVASLLAGECQRVVPRIQPRIDRSAEVRCTIMPWDTRYPSLAQADDIEDSPTWPERFRMLPSRFALIEGGFKVAGVAPPA